jgi:hypothetical protein
MVLLPLYSAVPELIKVALVRRVACQCRLAPTLPLLALSPRSVAQLARIVLLSVSRPPRVLWAHSRMSPIWLHRRLAHRARHRCIVVLLD